MSLNNRKSSTYLLVGSLTALGGIALGVTGSWIYNKLSKNKNGVTRGIITQHTNCNQTDFQNHERTDGVYIQDENETHFLTNDEFQIYFEYNINSVDGIEFDSCLLEYSLTLDPLNLRFFKDAQQTLAFEKLAVEQDITAIVHCRSKEEVFCVQIQSDILNENVTYQQYEIHDYAFELYGNDIYQYIDHPDGYSYEQLMVMPPPEFKDMTVSEVFGTFQNKTENTRVSPSSSTNCNIKEMIKEHIPDIPVIELTELAEELPSSDEEPE
jgi:hypothetical protein